MTLSETLFEKFCSNSGINFFPIQTGHKKSPDYELLIDEQRIIIEVTEIDKDKNYYQNSNGLINPPGYTPGEPIRIKIKKKLPQIKARTEGIYPSILVLFDRGQIAGYLDPYDIRVAMYGLEQIHMNVPINPSLSPYATSMSYGPKRKMTENHNTSISAIGGLFTPRPNEIILEVYHNKFAAVPLNPKLLAKYGIDQFALEDEERGKTAKWEKLFVKDDLIYKLHYEK
jgi:hypothetical protein